MGMRYPDSAAYRKVYRLTGDAEGATGFDKMVLARNVDEAIAAVRNLGATEVKTVVLLHEFAWLAELCTAKEPTP